MKEQEEKMQFEIKLHEKKLKLHEEYQLKTGSQSASAAHETATSQAKWPKLISTKFNGTFVDWPRFWGQYSESIDKSSLPPVTKFTYLRELDFKTVASYNNVTNVISLWNTAH